MTTNTKRNINLDSLGKGFVDSSRISIYNLIYIDI